MPRLATAKRHFHLAEALSETAMKIWFDDLAAALTSATLCVAAVSMLIVVLASAA